MVDDNELIRWARRAIKAGNLSEAERIVRSIHRRRERASGYGIKSGYAIKSWSQPARPAPQITRPAGGSGDHAVSLASWSPFELDPFGRPRT